MAISWNLRRVLDRKVWEMMTPAPVATNAGSFTVAERTGSAPYTFYMAGVSSCWVYCHNDDAWIQLPNSGLGGTWGAGTAGSFHHHGPTGTATAGTTTTITTNLTINRRINGEVIRITEGPNAGLERTILNNTYGANSVITVTEPFPVAITTSSKYLLLTGRIWVITGGTADFGYYDVALNTWTVTPSVTGLPTLGTDAKLVNTSTGANYYSVEGQATSGNGTTLTVAGKTWTVNQWANFQVRLTGGTGAGQVRLITSNTANTLTVPAWTTSPDSTTTYVIEGSEDFLYLLGNNAVTMYRYSISANTWATLNPTVARASAPGAGMSANWMNYATDQFWNNESAILNGRRIYSFRGAGSANLDYYDIPSNSWVALGTAYVPGVETFTTGTSYDVDDNYIYINKDATGRFFRYNVTQNMMFAWSTLLYPESTAVVGDKMWTKKIVDGDTTIKWVYKMRNNGAELFRCMIIDNDTNTTTGGWLVEEI